MLSEQKYASIGTKKHSGHLVWTPVWMAFLESKNAYYLFSAGAAGKVKRVRNYADIQVAPCTVSGKITGPAAHATAHQIRLANGHLRLFQQTQRQLQKTAIDRLFAIKPGSPQNNRNPVAASSHYLSLLSALS